MPKENSQLEEMPSDDELMGIHPDDSEEPSIVAAEDFIDDEDGEEIVTNVQPEEEPQRVEEPKQQMVPHQAMHQERVARQNAEAENKQLKSQIDNLTGRMDQLMQMIQQANQPQQKTPEEEDPRPDPEESPFEFMQWQQRRIDALENQFKTTTQQTQQQTEFQKTMNAATEQAAQFRNSLEDPKEYDEAYNYVFQKRGEELIAMGVPHEQIADALRNEAVQGIMFAQQRGINPGQMLMNMAKNRGFVYAKQQPQPPQRQQAPSPAPQPPEEFRSMSGGQTPRTDTLDMQAIANMSEDDFADWIEKNGDKGLAKMHGLG